MKLIVEIEDEAYFKFMSGNPFGSDVLNAISYGLVKKSQILPKGHGRLIDADKLSQDDEVTEWVSRDAVRTGKQLKMFSELFLKKIKDAPTVVKADKDGD